METLTLKSLKLFPQNKNHLSSQTELPPQLYCVFKTPYSLFPVSNNYPASIPKPSSYFQEQTVYCTPCLQYSKIADYKKMIAEMECSNGVQKQNKKDCENNVVRNIVKPTSNSYSTQFNTMDNSSSLYYTSPVSDGYEFTMTKSPNSIIKQQFNLKIEVWEYNTVRKVGEIVFLGSKLPSAQNKDTSQQITKKIGEISCMVNDRDKSEQILKLEIEYQRKFHDIAEKYKGIQQIDRDKKKNQGKDANERNKGFVPDIPCSYLPAKGLRTCRNYSIDHNNRDNKETTTSVTLTTAIATTRSPQGLFLHSEKHKKFQEQQQQNSTITFQVEKQKQKRQQAENFNKKLQQQKLQQLSSQQQVQKQQRSVISPALKLNYYKRRKSNSRSNNNWQDEQQKSQISNKNYEGNNTKEKFRQKIMKNDETQTTSKNYVFARRPKSQIPYPYKKYNSSSNLHKNFNLDSINADNIQEVRNDKSLHNNFEEGREKHQPTINHRRNSNKSYLTKEEKMQEQQIKIQIQQQTKKGEKKFKNYLQYSSSEEQSDLNEQQKKNEKTKTKKISININIDLGQQHQQEQFYPHLHIRNKYNSPYKLDLGNPKPAQKYIPPPYIPEQGRPKNLPTYQTSAFGKWKFIKQITPTRQASVGGSTRKPSATTAGTSSSQNFWRATGSSSNNLYNGAAEPHQQLRL